MNDRSRNLNLMFHRLELHFNNNRSVWESNDLINTQISSYLDQRNELSGLLAQSEKLKGRYSPIRNEEREQFNRHINSLAQILKAFNAQLLFNEKGELNKDVALSGGALLRLSLTDSINKATVIIDAAENHRAELEALEGSKKIYEQARMHYNSFAQRLFLPSLRIGERKMLLQNIDQQERSLLTLLKTQIDARVNILSYDWPDFGQTYTDIRSMRINKAAKKQEEPGSPASAGMVGTPTAENNNPNEYAIAV